MDRFLYSLSNNLTNIHYKLFAKFDLFQSLNYDLESNQSNIPDLMKKKVIFRILMMALFITGLSSCKKRENLPSKFITPEYFVSAWSENSLPGLNPLSDKQKILQLNHNLIVRVVKRGNPPKSATTGITVSYEIKNYKISIDKNSEPEGKVISGNMVESKGLFRAEGIQAIINDTFNSYQSASIIVKTSDGKIIANAHLMIPAFDVSNGEMFHGTTQPPCEICHNGMNWTNPREVFYGQPKGKGNPFCIACHDPRPSAIAGLEQGSTVKLLNQQGT